MNPFVEVGQVWEYRAGGQIIDVYLVVGARSMNGMLYHHLVDLRSLEEYPAAHITPSDDLENSWWRVA